MTSRTMGRNSALVAVTGASGFVGRHVVRALSRGGHRVAALSRRESSGLASGANTVTWHQVDASVPGNVARWIRDQTPSAVINAAGYGVAPGERDGGLLQRINVDLVDELGAALAEVRYPADGRVRLVHFGSAFEYGSIDGPVTEAAVCNPLPGYAETKLAGTETVLGHSRNRGLNAVVLRIATAYGPGEHAHRLLPTLLRAASHGGPVALSHGEQQRDFVFVGDIAEAAARSLQALQPREVVFNLCTGALSSVRDFVLKAAAVLGIPQTELRFGSVPSRSDELRQGVLSTHRLGSWLGWVPPTTIEASVRASLKELRE